VVERREGAPVLLGMGDLGGFVQKAFARPKMARTRVAHRGAPADLQPALMKVDGVAA
jgi:hypothetical protein